MPVPYNLTLLSATSNSIRLFWDFDKEGEISTQDMDGYRVFYKRPDSFDDVNTVKTKKKHFQHELEALEPFTKYLVWVRAIVSGQQSTSSDTITVNTDVMDPSPPEVENVTCYSENRLYLQWRRPSVYQKSLDYYKIYFRNFSDAIFRSLIIQASKEKPIVNVSPIFNI